MSFEKDVSVSQNIVKKKYIYIKCAYIEGLLCSGRHPMVCLIVVHNWLLLTQHTAWGNEQPTLPLAPFTLRDCTNPALIVLILFKIAPSSSATKQFPSVLFIYVLYYLSLLAVYVACTSDAN